MKKYLKLVGILLLSISVTAQQKQVISDNGMVVSAHPEASAAGVSILKKGGNAIDAAIAVEFTLAVVYSNAGNIGGGGFLVYRGHDGQIDALDYRETAPSKASRDMYLDRDGNADLEASQYGTLAVGVPGTVAGMQAAHQKYGNLPWKELLEPAIKIAETGFQITSKQAALLNEFRTDLIKYNPNGCAFVKKNQWQAGDLLTQKELAQTLRLIRDEGKDAFYKGKIANSILEQMKQSKGIISAEDLENYKPIWRQPITAKYDCYKIISMPPPSSGGIALITLLQAVERYPIAKWGFQQDSTVQIMVESQRRAYADRAEYLGDPDFLDIPKAELLSNDYINRRMRDIDFARATPSSQIGKIDLSRPESEQTTHYSVVDKDRNAVSVTTTLNGNFGSKVVVKGAGFLLNNEMDDFSIKPGTPNQFGLVGGEANSIAPNKRMLSSMTPTILEKEGELYLTVGAPGGSTIINSVFETIINITQFGMDAQTAVAKPRFHHQWLPDNLQVEDGAIPDEVRSRLVGKGYTIVPRDAFGKVEVIRVIENNQLEGGADPRGDDRAIGY